MTYSCTIPMENPYCSCKLTRVRSQRLLRWSAGGGGHPRAASAPQASGLSWTVQTGRWLASTAHPRQLLLWPAAGPSGLPAAGRSRRAAGSLMATVGGATGLLGAATGYCIAACRPLLATAHRGRQAARWASGGWATGLTAALPMENPYCSCKLSMGYQLTVALAFLHRDRSCKP